MEQEWFFHWDNAPVHTAAIVQDWFAARNIQRLNNLRNSSCSGG
jgi:hypothetical protein